mmetsp:Transcript_13132/g.27819  ORF Transcript_13132/g.27819 Transcript_13132/m.27819 type:complete len:295 (+) Transcript_13132:5252-6136(+)
MNMTGVSHGFARNSAPRICMEPEPTSATDAVIPTLKVARSVLRMSPHIWTFTTQGSDSLNTLKARLMLFSSNWPMSLRSNRFMPISKLAPPLLLGQAKAMRVVRSWSLALNLASETSRLVVASVVQEKRAFLGELSAAKSSSAQTYVLMSSASSLSGMSAETPRVHFTLGIASFPGPPSRCIMSSSSLFSSVVSRASVMVYGTGTRSLSSTITSTLTPWPPSAVPSDTFTVTFMKSSSNRSTATATSVLAGLPAAASILTACTSVLSAVKSLARMMRSPLKLLLSIMPPEALNM